MQYEERDGELHDILILRRTYTNFWMYGKGSTLNGDVRSGKDGVILNEATVLKLVIHSNPGQAFPERLVVV